MPGLRSPPHRLGVHLVEPPASELRDNPPPPPPPPRSLHGAFGAYGRKWSRRCGGVGRPATPEPSLHVKFFFFFLFFFFFSRDFVCSWFANCRRRHRGVSSGSARFEGGRTYTHAVYVTRLSIYVHTHHRLAVVAARVCTPWIFWTLAESISGKICHRAPALLPGEMGRQSTL